MRVRLPSIGNNAEIEGQFSDLDAGGNLVLLLPDGTQRLISAGDIFF
jgi:biotin-(acetyl-CoA carboxylase) ligase